MKRREIEREAKTNFRRWRFLKLRKTRKSENQKAQNFADQKEDCDVDAENNVSSWKTWHQCRSTAVYCLPL
jgi:hypothetical protein